MDLFYHLCRLCLDRSGEYNLYDVEGLVDDIELHIGIKHSTNEITTDLNHEKANANIYEKPYIVASTLITSNVFYQLPDSSRNKETFSECASPEPTSDCNKLTVCNDIITTNKEAKCVYNKLSVHSDLLPNNKSKPFESKCKKISLKSHHLSLNKVVQSKSEESVKVRSPTAVTFSEVMVHPNVRLIKKVKKRDELILSCPHCDKVFDKWKKYYHHLRTHTKTYECPINDCGKKFACKGDLEKHIRVHTREKPYECDICYRRFTQRCSLKSHMENVHGRTFSVSLVDS